MKGVILAGGLGSRLYPLTKATNKHLLPVYDKPMIFYPINTLVKAGIKEVMIVTGGPHSGHFFSILKNGHELGIKHLEYAYQEGEGGIADALSLSRDFVDGDSAVVILGDNTTDYNLLEDAKTFTGGALIFLKKVPDPERFGVPIFDKDNPNLIREIVEKPKVAPNDFAVSGIYIYDHQVFEFIQTLKPSQRGELEITDVNNHYAKIGKLKYKELKGFWHDAGTFDTLLETNIFWSQKSGEGK